MELLKQEHILLGYELEDCQLEKINGKEIHQFLVRPISRQNFIEIWEHGKEYCSKFYIYIKDDGLFNARRPDMLNYDGENDTMYNSEDIMSIGKEIQTELTKRFGEDVYKHDKANLNNRIDCAIDNLIEVQDLGGGKYNILFEIY